MTTTEMTLEQAWAELQAIPAYVERYTPCCEECGARPLSVDGWRCWACFNVRHQPAITEVRSYRFEK